MTAYLLILCLAQDDLDARLDKLFARMKESLAERKKAADELAEMVQKDRKVIPVLREKARKETDVRVRTRVQAIVSLDYVEKAWEVAATGPISLQVTQGKVWFQRGDGRIVGLDSATGEQKVLTPVLGWTRFVPAGDVIAGLKSGAAHMIDTKTGRVSEIAPCTQGPVADAGGFAFIDGQGRLQIRSKKKMDVGVPPGAQIAVGEGKVMVWSGDDQIAALNLDDGKQAWTAKCDQAVTQFVAWDGFLFARTKRSRMRAYEIATGKNAWIEDLTGDEEREAPILKANGRLHLFGPTKITVRDLKTGAVIWSGSPEWYTKSPGRVPVVMGDLFAYAEGTSIVTVNADALGAERTRTYFDAGITTLVSDGKRAYFIAGDHVYGADFSPARKLD